MERISTHQFTMLSAAVLLGTTFFPLGSLVTGIAGRDGWMAVIPGFLWAIPLGLMLLSLIAKYPDNSLFEIAEKVLGKWVGKGLGLLYILVASYFGAVLSRQGVDLFSRTILPLMPHYVFIIGSFLLIFFLYLNGIEVLGRFAEVVLPLVLAALTLTAILTIPRFERGELFPILANGLKPVLYASTKVAPFPLEYILFLSGLLPFLPRKPKEIRQMKKGLWRAFFIVVFINTIIVLIQIQTFGPFEAARLNYGLLVLGKMLEVSRSLAGVESVFALFWMGALAIKVAAFFFSGVWGIQSVFGLNNRKVGYLLGIFYLSIPFFFQRGAEIQLEIAAIDEYLILPLTVLSVLMVWGVDKWKSRHKS